MKRSKIRLLSEMSTAVLGVNDEVYDDIDSLQSDQLTTM